MATNANQRDNAAIGCSSVEEEDLEPSPVTGGSAALTDATRGESQSGWTRAKLSTPHHVSLRKQGDGLWILGG
jgi:hypothetical protein